MWAGTGVRNPTPSTRAASASRTSIRLKPGLLGVCVPLMASVGGNVILGVPVAASGMVGTKTSEMSLSGSVSSESIVATFSSGCASSEAPTSTVAW